MTDLETTMIQPPKPTPPRINLEYRGVFYHYYGPEPNRRWIMLDQIAWAAIVFLFFAVLVAEYCWVFASGGSPFP